LVLSPRLTERLVQALLDRQRRPDRRPREFRPRAWCRCV